MLFFVCMVHVIKGNHLGHRIMHGALCDGVAETIARIRTRTREVMNQPEMRAWLKATHKPGTVTDDIRVTTYILTLWSHAAVGTHSCTSLIASRTCAAYGVVYSQVPHHRLLCRSAKLLLQDAGDKAESLASQCTCSSCFAMRILSPWSVLCEYRTEERALMLTLILCCPTCSFSKLSCVCMQARISLGVQTARLRKKGITTDGMTAEEILQCTLQARAEAKEREKAIRRQRLEASRQV